MKRDDKLASQLNKFWNGFLKTNDVDYYKRLTIFDFVKLKEAISNINNIITLQITEAFVEFLKNENIVSENQKNCIISQVVETNANANGYDIEWRDGSLSIIAEVKCNIPVKQNSFGAAQRNGIVKDLDNLLKCKSKSNLDSTSDCLKFMVLLDVKNVRDCMKKVIDGYNKGNGSFLVEEYNGKTTLSKEKVYVVYLRC